ncbi:histidine kinase-like protein [Sulfuritortus calidifontis]|uniref:Histidine kinase-like protein n=1 Tax=Sulfuritortus calidifontis TaxID=1914471 RepID=A0A4R3JZ04_9PROT|nr:fused response regulator/phosphatase [Sulfuritortus calidifontis]TCS72234.1 histidine kinase-like protein [Sulfuritortus calidifontis]
MRPLKVLIVDDTLANAKLVETVVNRLGHTSILAENGQRALDLFESEQPDLVLMDVMMPVMDGITATQALRARLRSLNRWVPILLLSALDDISDIVRGLEAGADDYVVKPVNIQLLKAKLQNFTHQVEMQEQILRHTAELEHWHAMAQQQSELGSHIMDRLINAGGVSNALVSQFNIPADTFSGDLICAARTPDDITHLLLADATGHGLPAALSAIPIAGAFYRMTEKGFPISSIAREMNTKLRQFLPADRFVAATLAAIDVKDQVIEVWNGGNPSALLIGASGNLLKDWPSQHPPLGVLPEAAFSELVETISYKEDCNLLICSDGLWEAESPSGQRIDRGRILDLFAATDKDQHLTGLQSLVQNHLAGAPALDDISGLLAWIPIERRAVPRVEGGQAKPHLSHKGEWHLAISYWADELKYLDVVPDLLDLICQVQVLKPHKSSLFIVLSELFNNALDHGLLGLDSKLKASGDFEQYMQQREARLTELDDGRIDISFWLHNSDDATVLDIKLTDSGDGFDYERYLDEESLLRQTALPHGRGLALVRSLCSQLRYAGSGNQVIARYVL